MKILCTVAAMLFVTTSCAAATLRLTATAPTQDNAGSCLVPNLVPMGVNPALWMHFSWTGPQAGEDSVLVSPGAPVVYTRAGLLAGSYTVRAYAKDAGGAGCDTTITLLLKNPPWKPRF